MSRYPISNKTKIFLDIASSNTILLVTPSNCGITRYIV